jgi:putative transposase
MRHTTFRFALNPTPVQELALARHAGAARFGYNQCLRMVTDALAARKTNPHIIVPWSRYDLNSARFLGQMSCLVDHAAAAA